MPDTPLPPPGWYADPGGRDGSRWWDGSAWTDHVRAARPNDDPPPVPTGGPAGEAPGGEGTALPLSLRGRHRALGVAIFVVLAVALVATAVVGLGNAGPGGGLARDDGQPLGQVLPEADVPPPLDRVEVVERAEAAGCRTVVDGEPLEDVSHLDRSDAPPPDALYPDRPAHSGPHDGGLLPLPAGTATVPIDERAVLHNMEHGAVVVWFDPAQVDAETRRAISAWREQREDLGFTSESGGAVYASPAPDMDDPPAVSLRAWGVAVDCDRFAPLVADGFLADHWGSHGAAPEASLSPYPEDSLRFRETA